MGHLASRGVLRQIFPSVDQILLLTQVGVLYSNLNYHVPPGCSEFRVFRRINAVLQAYIHLLTLEYLYEAYGRPLHRRRQNLNQFYPLPTIVWRSKPNSIAWFMSFYSCIPHRIVWQGPLLLHRFCTEQSGTSWSFPPAFFCVRGIVNGVPDKAKVCHSSSSMQFSPPSSLS